ncbi:MAG: ABC transporter ATP-binding protein [Acetobacteraceae bacterium]|nr:ABC transporter ATP-binding protein [Acetobacteraceae bacterium]
MLRVEGLEAGYGRTRVLRGVSFHVPERGLVALLGGNGTGKSTVLKAVAGLLRPTAGTITLAGGRIDGMAAERLPGRGLVLVPQGKEVFAAMSVEENLLMGAFHRRGARGALAADLDAAYTRFPRLNERRRLAAGMLSGGERQMLAIARALMARPRLLLLDEPSAALAPKLVDEIADAILALRNEAGLTLLLVEQNVGMALDLADHIHVLRDGRIAFERAVADGVAIDELREYYLGGKIA